MRQHPLEVERLIGWISFALGMSALQENDSTFYRISVSTLPLAWIATYCVLGITLVLTTYTTNTRCRMLLLAMLLLTWSAGLGLVIATGPLGAYGAIAIVIVAFIINILWTKVRGEGSASI